ncbi:MAG: hypothetical protein Q4C56_10085, partial [Peptococcaceae bacterium]|nr:hypothetical protein [Peptococcaceae bacterium]
ARVLDIDALGCAASEDGISDGGLLAREFFARIKDFCQLRADALPAPLAGAAHSLYTHLIYPAFH